MMKRSGWKIGCALLVLVGCATGVRSMSRGPSSVEDMNKNVKGGRGNLIMEIPQHAPKEGHKQKDWPEFRKKSDIASADKDKTDAMGMNRKLLVGSMNLTPGMNRSVLQNGHNFADAKSPKAGGSAKAAMGVDARPIRQALNLARNMRTETKRMQVEKRIRHDGQNKKFNENFMSEATARQNARATPVKRKPQQTGSTSGCYSYYDDYYEPNDSQYSAYDLTGYDGVWLSEVDDFGVQGDDDYFKIYVPEAYRRLTVDLRFYDVCSDIDLKVYDASGSQIASSTGTSDDEYISVNLAHGGYYYVKVYFGNDDAYYDLKWETSYTGANDDSYEDNDYIFNAYNLSGWENRWLSSLYGYGVAKDDADHYKIHVDQGYLRVVVDLRFWHQYGDLELELKGADGTPVYASSKSANDDEYIDFTVPAPGDYIIKVYPYSNADEIKANQYDLRWYLVQTGPVWAEDSYEQNDSLSAAKQIGVGNISNLHQFDEDWYKISVSDVQRRVTVDANFVDSEGDIDLRFYDSGGNIMGSSTSSFSSNEHVDVTVPEPGTYYIKISGSNAGNPYSLNVATSATPPSNDPYNNATFGSAYDLSGKDNVWLSNIQGLGILTTDDHYKFYVNPNLRHIYVDARFNKTAGDIDIELYNDGNALIGYSRGVTSDEQIELYLQETGRFYYIRVTGKGARNAQTYDLKVSAQPLSPMPPPPTGQVNVMEFYNPVLKHYFITATPEEAQMLDAGVIVPGWWRTGYEFRGYAAGGSNRNPVCRFFGRPEIGGPNSHFYTASVTECAHVKNNLPLWKFEENTFFSVDPAGGSCPAGHRPILRMYNNGKDGEANHRYLVNPAQQQADMLSKGWVVEGNVFCSPDNF